MKLANVHHRTSAAAGRVLPKTQTNFRAARHSRTQVLHLRPTASARSIVCAAAAQDTLSTVTALPPINLTDNALAHLTKLRAEAGGELLLLRVGVKQGGCSGLSYQMDFERLENISADDTVVEYDGGSFKIVADPKSLLYLFGMELDYSDALIGGGFQFNNPNASQSCGCGKSFGV